ncbi:AMP-binding protein, partial [Alistipes ihumii]|uniref:AMP-binding protein n=1 Tax=Alistipes ihumii TaxID=1470347 RepID=UPI003FEED6D3
FSKGARVVYLDRQPTASALMPALKAVRPTVMLIVPLIIEKIYRHQVQAKFNSNAFWRTLVGIGFMRRYLHRIAGKKLMRLFGGRIRFFGIGGAKLDPRVEQFLFEGKFPYAIGYGLTETAPVLAGVNPTMVRHQSTGPMLQGIEARLDNVNPLSGEGEIVVKGPNVMMGYYKNPEATADSFTEDGWFRTKDLGVFDADGYLYIKGRLSNMILGPSGENIYPEEIENVLNGHALVNDSLVQEDDMGKLVAIVYFNREELERKYQTVKEKLGARMEEIKKELLHYVNSKVNRFSRISVVVENQEGFEKTPTHKIKRFLYGKKHESGK